MVYFRKVRSFDQDVRRPTTMVPIVFPEQRQKAKRQMIELIEQGTSVQQARSQSTVPMHRTTIYRLLKRVQADGENAYTDGRHGHPVKVRGEVRTFLTEYCQATPSPSSTQLQQAIEQRFSLRLSVSQLNRVRASLGLTYHRPPQEKKAQHLSQE
jgi:putative transposase